MIFMQDCTSKRKNIVPTPPVWWGLLLGSRFSRPAVAVDWNRLDNGNSGEWDAECQWKCGIAACFCWGGKWLHCLNVQFLEFKWKSAHDTLNMLYSFPLLYVIIRHQVEWHPTSFTWPEAILERSPRISFEASSSDDFDHCCGHGNLWGHHVTGLAWSFFVLWVESEDYVSWQDASIKLCI